MLHSAKVLFVLNQLNKNQFVRDFVILINISFPSKGRNKSQLHFFPQGMRDVILIHHIHSLIQALLKNRPK